MIPLIFISLTLVLAAAVSGIIHVRSNDRKVTITLETGATWAWIRAATEAMRELIGGVFRRAPNREEEDKDVAHDLRWQRMHEPRVVLQEVRGKQR